MAKDFKQELTELINKHGLEKEMRDTPDYILAQVAVDAMAVFSEAVARRDEWHGFRNADKNYNDGNQEKPTDCGACKFRFKCASYLSKCSINDLLNYFHSVDGELERNLINEVLKDVEKALKGQINKNNDYQNTCIRELINMPKQALWMMYWDKRGKYEMIAISEAIKMK